MEEYYFKDFQPHSRTGSGANMLVVEVAKFNFRRRPEVVYKVQRSGRDFWSCDCPAGRDGHCKHVTMVLAWLAAGRPSPFERFCS